LIESYDIVIAPGDTNVGIGPIRASRHARSLAFFSAKSKKSSYYIKRRSIVGHFFIHRDIKKVLLIAIEHKLQIEYRQTLRINENNNRIPLVTIPIDIGENTFPVFCLPGLRGSVQQSFIHHPYLPTNT
jgi:hypothetical protein